MATRRKYNDPNLNVLNRQVIEWARTVNMFVHRYEFSVDDYVNDLAIRQSIARRLKGVENVPPEIVDLLQRADSQLVKESIPTKYPLVPYEFQGECWNNVVPSNTDASFVSEARARGMIGE